MESIRRRFSKCCALSLEYEILRSERSEAISIRRVGFKTLPTDAAFELDLIAATPLRRLAEPADVARAAAFLALLDSAYVTGQLIAVDGGYLGQGL